MLESKKDMNESYDENVDIVQFIIMDDIFVMPISSKDTPIVPKRIIDTIYNKFVATLSDEDRKLFDCIADEEKGTSKSFGYDGMVDYVVGRTIKNAFKMLGRNPKFAQFLKTKKPIRIPDDYIFEDLLNHFMYEKDVREDGHIKTNCDLDTGLDTDIKKQLGLESEDKGKKPTKGDAKKYTIYIKDPKTGETKKLSFGKGKQDEEVYAPPFKEPKKKEKKDKEEREPQKILNKDVGELLNEIIDPNAINVEKLNIKNRLCPKIWDNEDEMNPEVRQALLKNALEFIKFSGLENASFKDIILTGSLANYNWHEGSDLDVHILMDYDQISDDNEFVGEFFRTKKALWAERLPITVKDHDVELYVQDTNEPHTSTGVYSLLNDKWLTKPIKSMVALDIPNIRAKSIDFMNIIDELEASDSDSISIDQLERLMDKLKAYRKAGLDDEGEFSTENLVFKVLRNTGYLEKIADLKQSVLVNQLTLENVGMYDPGLADEI